MIRRGLISKRKLIVYMNMMMKGGKLLRNSLSNPMSHHHHARNVARAASGPQEYEFSCNNSPNPVFFHVPKRKHRYFPCINAPEVIEEEGLPEALEAKTVVLVPQTPEYAFNPIGREASDFDPGEKRSPLLSPFSIRVSNYSSEDENEGGNGQVDHEAEQFIRRFYEQLRVQSRMQLLHYQELQYQEMLARGSH